MKDPTPIPAEFAPTPTAPESSDSPQAKIPVPAIDSGHLVPSTFGYELVQEVAEKGLGFFGSKFAEACVGYWRHKAAHEADLAKYYLGAYNVIHGHTAADFIAMSSSYEDPQFIDSSDIVIGSLGQNEPRDVNAYRKGDTTFNRCGWCRYVSGVFRGQCCLVGQCQLGGRYTEFNSGCYLKKEYDLEPLAKALEERRASNAAWAIDYQLRVENLLGLIAEADLEDKPLLPELRPFVEWGKKGGRVAIFIEGDTPAKDAFFPGSLEPVRYGSDAIVNLDNGITLHGDPKSPELITTSEFAFLYELANDTSKDPGFLGTWLRYAAWHNRRFNPARFLLCLRER